MPMNVDLLLKLGAVAALVAANAYFVAVEFALVTARRSRIRELVDRGDRLAGVVQNAQESIDLSVSGAQLGITLASLGLGWIGEPAIADTLRRVFVGWPTPWSSIATHTTAIVIAFSLITFLHVVLGEQVPKMVAIIRPVQVARLTAPGLRLFNLLIRPGLWLINGSSNLVLRVLGMPGVDTHHTVHTPDEIQILLQDSLREGAVELDEEAMIHGVFELTHTVAREVMTPRPDIQAVEADAGLEEVLEVAARTGHSRFPVYEDSIDKIVGVLIVKDLLPWFLKEDRSGFRAADGARAPFYVPESKHVDDLLAEMRRQKVHLAVVVDEFGGTDGIVTLEDLLEEIVGDIYDEHDVAEQPSIAVKPSGRVEVDGGMSLSDLVEELHLAAVEEEYDTVAGYVIGTLGRIPEEGERVMLGEAELEVREVADRRVTLLELHYPDVPAAGDGIPADEEAGGPSSKGRKRPA
ncbi:MAG: hemolysin family protein [Gemmatimonadales bacterium]|jgi:CBS domain containing-hemolysin-like protein